MTFKIGDKVEVIKSYDDYKVGHIGVITSIQDYPYLDNYYRIDGASGGSTADFFKKVEDKPMFKVGAKVKIIANTNNSCNKVGDIGVIASDKTTSNGSYQVEVPNRFGGNWTRPSDMVLVEDDIYEDGWILNDGKVTIPDDAQKSMHEGSVVAFRKRKTPPLQFGDKVMCEGELCIYLRKDRINDALVVLARENEFNISRHLSKITKV